MITIIIDNAGNIEMTESVGVSKVEMIGLLDGLKLQCDEWINVLNETLNAE